MPYDLKEAVLKHKIKEDSLDCSLTFISNIRLLTKATEKAVAFKLDYHLTNSNGHELYQSACKKGHSTEIVLLRVDNDILSGINDG